MQKHNRHASNNNWHTAGQILEAIFVFIIYRYRMIFVQSKINFSLLW